MLVVDKSFMVSCCGGACSVEQIGDFVDYWHAHDTGKTLRDFLGMNPDEYALWMREGDSVLPEIVRSHVDNSVKFEVVSKVCPFHLEIPNVGMCCDAYSQSRRQDGYHWSHYPACCEVNCPLLYESLLEGAELKKDGVRHGST